MPDYQIDVAVEPDASRFPEQLAAAVRKAEARQDPLEVEVEPKLGRDFSREAQRKVRTALAALDAELAIEPKLSKGFARELSKLVQAATAGGVEVTVTPTLSRRFRSELAAQVKAAAAGGRPIEVPVSAKLSSSFRRDLQRSIDGAFPRGAEVKVSPTLSRTGLAEFTAELQRKLVQVGTALEASGATDIRFSADTALMASTLPGEIAALTTAISASEAASVEVSADTSKARAEMALLDSSVGGVGTRLSSIGRLARTGLLVGLAAVAATAAAAFTAAVVSTSDFEQQLSNLQAVAGVNGDQLQQLSEQALQAGRDTAFSASEAAEAQVELAKAGASVEQVLGGGLTAALDLAAAGEIALGDAATFVATGLNTFALGADEAGRVADTLAAAANRSATDIPQMGYALQQSGLVAKQFGLSIEETSGVLALFAQNGLVGSDAGTSFRTMLQRLNPQSEEAATAMRDLGLNLYDAQGNFVGIEETAGQLQTALSGLSEEQRSAAIQTIFGADAARAANIVYEAGAPGIADWTAQVTDAGNASETAAAKLDNLRGDLTKLRGSLETVFIEAGQGSTSGLRQLVQSLTEVVNSAGPALARALTPISALLVELTPAISDLTLALAPLLEGFVRFAGPIGTAALELFAGIAGGAGALFTALAPLGAAIGGVIDALRPVLAVVGDVAAEVGDALVPAFEALAEPEVGAALSELAEAFGELLVSIAPLLPDLVAIGVVLIESLLPVVEALTPAVSAAAQVLVPLLQVLARLAPLIVVGVALTKLVQGIAQVGTAMRSLVEQMGALRGKFEAALGGPVGSRLFTGLTTAAAAAGTAIAGYMAGAAQDSTTQLLSIGAAASGVFLAFQTGGPVGAALAAATAAVGYFFGQQAKAAKEAKAEQEAYASSVAELRDAFDTAGLDRYSGAQARQLVVAQQLTETMRESSAEATSARTAFGALGIDFATVTAAAAEGTDGLAALNAEIDAATTRRSGIISQQAIDGLTDFGVLTDEVRQSIIETADELAGAGDAADPTALNAYADAVMAGDASLQELSGHLRDYQGVQASANEVQETFARNLQENLSQSAAAEYLRSLPETTRDAFREQSQLAELQRQIAVEQDRNRGSAERYSDAYAELAGNIDASTEAYSTWLRQQQGGEVTLAELTLGVVDYARELQAITDSDVSPFEKTQQELVAVAGAQQLVAESVGTFIQQSGGDYDVFTGKIDALRLQLIDGLVQSLGISTESAAGLVAEILQIPDEKQFAVLADTTQAVTSVDDLNARVLTYILSDVSNVAELNEAPATQRLAILEGLLDEYVASDPKAKAFLDSLTAEQRAEALTGLLNGLDGRQVNVSVNVQAQFDAEVGRLADLANRNALGGLYTSPLFTLVGEDGPEVILPLTKPDRMRELLSDPLVAAALAGVSSAAPVASAALGAPASPAATSPTTVGTGLGFVGTTEQLDAWVTLVVDKLTALGTLVAEGSLPPLDEWRLQVEALFGQLAAGIERFTLDSAATLAVWASVRVPTATIPALTLWAAQVADVARRAGDGAAVSWGAGLARLAPLSSTAGSSAVSALTSALSSGTGEVQSIVGGYAVALADALNPLLRAVGKPELPDVVRRARGGYVPGPNVERDVVPALLMPGEVVIRKSSVEQFGVQNLLRLNRGLVPPGWRVPGYAEGGVAAATGSADLRGRAIESAQRSIDNLSTAFPPLPPTIGQSGAVADAARGSMDYARSGVSSWLDEMSSKAGGAGAGLARLWLLQAIALTGVPLSWLPGLLTIARRESGFNPRAINLWDSNAAKGVPSMGLMQTILPTFRAYALPGLNDVYNPVHNAVAAIRYILARYGDIANVQQANPNAPPRGYAAGGLVTAEGLHALAAHSSSSLSSQLRAVSSSSSSSGVVRTSGRSVTVEGDVIVQVTPPGAADPQNYGAALSHRIVPALAAVLAR